MLFGFLLTLYVIACLLIILLVMVQKGKSSMGLGNLGGGTQMLFGGSGGQDLFQRATWILGAIFMGGSLLLSIMKTTETQKTRFIKKINGPKTTQQAPAA